MSEFNKVQAYGDYLLVEAPEVEEKTDSGIIIPEKTAKDIAAKKSDIIFLKVLSVGTGVVDITKGDLVFAPGQHPIADIEGKTCILLHKQGVYLKKKG